MAVAMVAAVTLAAQTTEDLIAKNLAARGGVERLESARSLRSSGRIVSEGGEGTLLVEWLRAGGLRKIRTEITVDGRTVARGFNGVRAWRQVWQDDLGWLPAGRLVGDEAENLREDAEFDDGLLDAHERGATVRYDGHATIDGRDVYKLMLRLRDGNVFYCFLDAATLLERRRVGGRVTGGREALIEWNFGDYRSSGGMRVPFRIDSVSRDTGERRTIAIERIEWNPALDDARFEPSAADPGGGRGGR